MNKLHYWSEKQIIDKLKISLCNNNIVITSTDTILGFLGNITLESFDKITKIKEKRENKPFLVIINSIDKLSKFVDIQSLEGTNVNKLLKKHWPGPLTVIFKAKKDLPSFLQSKENTIAIRCPQHKGLQEILQHFDGLFSTSANRTNQPTPINYKDLDPEIIKQVQFVLIESEKHTQPSPTCPPKPPGRRGKAYDYAKATTHMMAGTASVETFNVNVKEKVDTKNKLNQTLPSTIIDVSDTSISGGNIKLVRKGAYPVEDLEKTYGTKFKK